jgi:hypothetical protein
MCKERSSTRSLRLSCAEALRQHLMIVDSTALIGARTSHECPSRTGIEHLTNLAEEHRFGKGRLEQCDTCLERAS